MPAAPRWRRSDPGTDAEQGTCRVTGIYLDWNATAPLRAEARAALLAALDGVGNASSVHGCGRAARKRVEDARGQVAALVGARAAEVVFTASGTEANNMALRVRGVDRLLVLSTDHASVLAAAAGAVHLPVGPDGVIDLPVLERELAAGHGRPLVSVQAVNNETGVVQPLAAVARLVHAQGGLLHTDAVQAAGRLPIDRDGWGADLLTLSAHKIGGLPGVGALVLRPGIDLDPLVKGGGQERRARAGTENVPGIAAFGAAAEAAGAGLAAYQGLAALRDGLEDGLLADVPGLAIAGRGVLRVANTSCLILPGLPADTQLMALDLAGIAVSSGAACSSGKVGPSHVLTAMGMGPDRAGCAIRVSLGWTSTAAEVERFAACYRRLAARRRTG